MQKHTIQNHTSTVLSLIVALLIAAATSATATAPEGTAARPWELEIGVGSSYKPDYSGSKDLSLRLPIWASGKYQTDSMGTFALDSGSQVLDPQLRWSFFDSRDAGFGLLLGYRNGRDEKEPSLIGGGTGSPHLLGMGTIDTAVDAGFQGHLSVFGVPLFAQVRSALNSDQGTLAILGAYLPLKVGSRFELSVLPTVAWADSSQMLAFYGVTPAQSTRSGFRIYEIGAGWQDAALEIIGDFTISDGWHAIGSVAYLRLLADAAASPLVQEKGQLNCLLGLSYRF